MKMNIIFNVHISALLMLHSTTLNMAIHHIFCQASPFDHMMMISSLCHTATTYNCVYSTYEVLVIRDTCAIYVIHKCFIRFSFVYVRRCPLRVSADGSFRDFSFELLKILVG